MSFVGLNDFLIARIDPVKHTVITDPTQGGLTSNTKYAGVFDVNLGSAGGATKANVSNFQGSIAKKYGSNAVARASAGTPEPTVALGANALPFDVLARITGMIPDGNGGYVRTTTAEPNHCALIIGSTSWDGSQRYIGFYDGTCTMANTNIETNTNSEKISEDDLTFTALGVEDTVGASSTAGTTTTSVTSGGIVTTATGNTVKVYHMWDSSVSNFNYDAMIKEIFVQAAASSVPATSPSSK